MGKALALSRAEMVETLICYEGWATANGAAGGTTVVDAKLIGVNDYLTNKAVLIMEGPCDHELQGITGFDPGSGTITTFPFSAQITAGTSFRVVNFSDAALLAILLGLKSGVLAYLGYCPTGMAASQTDIRCPNLIGFGDAAFASNYEMMVVKNASSLHNAPEMEIRTITTYTSATGLFVVPAFSANVEASDIVIVCHSSVMSRISAFGWSDAGSGAGNVRDANRTEVDNWWNGQTIMMLNGAAKGQVRAIVDFIAASDDLIPSPVFDGAVGVNDTYVILSNLNPIVPAPDAALNYLTSDVVGNKADAAALVVSAVASIVAYVKGILQRANLILSQVLAIFTLKETGGTITSSGGVQDLYRVETPLGIFKPATLFIDFSNSTGAETIEIQVSYRIRAGGGPVLYDTLVFPGVITPAVRSIALQENRFGILVTLHRTAGGAQTYDYSVFYND